MKVPEALAKFGFLGDLPEDDLVNVERAFKVLTLKAGDTLWDQGAPVDGMVLTVSGLLSVLVDGMEVAHIGEGELAGEASIFVANSTRSARMTAHLPTTVLALSRANLFKLKEIGSPVYGRMVEQALQTLAQRVRVTDANFARLTVGERPIPTREDSSIFVRLWRALQPEGPSIPCPELTPLLRRHPLMADVGEDVITALAWAFTAQPVAEGEILCLEGEHGQAAFVVASGQVEVLRVAQGGRSELLATLGPGDYFGINALIQESTRTASCVAATAGWVFALDVEAYAELSGDPRLAWQEVMVSTLAAQIRNANSLLRRAMERSGDKGDNFQKELLRASGYLLGISSERAAD